MNTFIQYKIATVYIDAIKSSSNTPREFFILLSIKLAGNILEISKNLNKINIKNKIKKLFKI